MIKATDLKPDSKYRRTRIDLGLPNTYYVLVSASRLRRLEGSARPDAQRVVAGARRGWVVLEARRRYRNGGGKVEARSLFCVPPDESLALREVRRTPGYTVPA